MQHAKQKTTNTGMSAMFQENKKNEYADFDEVKNHLAN